MTDEESTAHRNLKLEDADEDLEIADVADSEHSGDDDENADGSDVDNLDDPDSSDDENEDEDEEEAARIREGFIVDDNDEDEEEDIAKPRAKKRRRKHNLGSTAAETGAADAEGEGDADADADADADVSRRESSRPRDDELDQDDLDLLLENTGAYRKEQDTRFKRLKRGGIDDEETEQRGLTEIFSDEEAEEETGEANRGGIDEFDDFIEEDEFSDDERRRREEEEVRTRPSQGKGVSYLSTLIGIDREKLSEIEEVFGTGEEYDWALEGEEDDMAGGVSSLEAPELKDVFEPGELQARLLTDEDNAIRIKDIPERYQLLRANIRIDYELEDHDFSQEQEWVFSKLEKEKAAFLSERPDLLQDLKKSVRIVLEFISKESLEVPFIWQHRRDYLIHIEPPTKSENGDQDDKLVVTTLLTPDDLWRIVHLDMEFHGIIEKRRAVKQLYDSLGEFDAVVEEALDISKELVDYQDCMDYLQFKYSAKIRSLATSDDANVRSNGHSQHKKHSRFGIFERIRSSKIYDLIKAFGVRADEIGENIEVNQRLNFAEDNPKRPLELAESLIEESGSEAVIYKSPRQALEAAEAMFSEELFHDLRIRRSLRRYFWQEAKIDIVLTDKGHKKIDEMSPYYDFKYAINRTFAELRAAPELYLRMLTAETQGLVEVRVTYPNYKSTLFEKILTRFFASDNVSDIAVQWNESRRRVLKNASRKLIPLICRNIREQLRTDCNNSLFFDIRKSLGAKLNQAPYKPPGYVAGTTAKVLAVSAGMGDFANDAILAVVVDESGQPVEMAKLSDPSSADFRTAISTLVKRQSPDVIGIAGFTVNSNKLYQILTDIVSSEKLAPGGDVENTLIEVVWVQDEVARLFQNSKKAEIEFPDRPSLPRYCIALGRYLQSPLLEYASLGKDIDAVEIIPHQELVPKEIFLEAVETSFVDYVNLVGIDINEALRNEYLGRLLMYISGLGPRKASGIIQGITSQGGSLNNRAELITKEITTKVIFFNCASFLKIPYDSSSVRQDEVEPLDGTRIHPEDHELARKMAADALELDEEDVASYESSGGVIAQLISEDPEKLDELILSEYADELERKFNQKKRMTLQIIKEELLNPFGEKREPIKRLSDIEVFTMLTGETKESLQSGSVVPASVKRISDRGLSVRLNSGIEGNVAGHNITDRRDVRPSSLFKFNQTVSALVLSVDYKQFMCELSTLEHAVKDAVERKRRNHDAKKWDFAAEDNDRRKVQQERKTTQKAGRIVKHPLFKLFNGRQAEEYLAPLQRGDLVIRPSSRGGDHIALTWKVGDQLYQHLDILEIPDRDVSSAANHAYGGKLYKVGESVYQDLDELIIMHIQSMARKVDEMVVNDKFQKGSKSDVEKWLTAYTDANPRRSIYAFCFDHKHPGYFLLCFKTSNRTPVQTWNVKVIPNGFELMGNVYADVSSLGNGFKRMFMHAVNNQYR